MVDFISAIVAEVEAMLDYRRDLMEMQRHQQDKLKQEKMMSNTRWLFLVLLLAISLMVAACSVPQQKPMVPTAGQEATIEALAGSDSGGCSICKAT
jgi:hypothetical protein